MGDSGTTDGRGRDADSPLDLPAKGWRDVALRIKDEMGADRTTLLSAGVAFYAFLSLIPGLALFVSVYGLVQSPEQATRQLDDFFRPLPDAAATLLTDQMTTVAERSATSLSFAAALSFLLALWSASSAMAQLMSAVGAIYDEPEDRGPVRVRLLAVIGLLLVVGSSSAFAGTLAAASRLGGPVGLVAQAAVYLAGAAVLAGGLAVLYRRGPDRRDARWRWLTPGAVVAVVGWAVATVGFQLYVSNLGSYQESYGALGAVVVLLLWLWISALVVLVGAHVNAEIEHQTAADSTVDGEQPIGERGAVVADTVGVSPE